MICFYMQQVSNQISPFGLLPVCCQWSSLVLQHNKPQWPKKHFLHRPPLHNTNLKLHNFKINRCSLLFVLCILIFKIYCLQLGGITDRGPNAHVKWVAQCRSKTDVGITFTTWTIFPFIPPWCCHSCLRFFTHHTDKSMTWIYRRSFDLCFRQL